MTVTQIEGLQPQNPDFTLNREKDLPCGISVPFSANDDMRFYVFVNHKLQTRAKLASDPAATDAPKTAIVPVVVPAGTSLGTSVAAGVLGAVVVTGIIAAETGNILIGSRPLPPGAIRSVSSISEPRANETTETWE